VYQLGICCVYIVFVAVNIKEVRNIISIKKIITDEKISYRLLLFDFSVEFLNFENCILVMF
jgi:hypothetical protein